MLPPPTSKLFRSLNFQLLSLEEPTDFGIKMVRVLGICRPVNGFLKVGDIDLLAAPFSSFLSSIGVFFRAYRTAPHTLGNPAAHGSFVCNRRCSCGRSRYMLYGCGKNAHSFFFLRQSRHCIDLFFIFFACRSSRMLFFCPALESHHSIAKLIPFGRSFNFQGTRGKYPQYIGSEKVHLWIPF